MRDQNGRDFQLALYFANGATQLFANLGIQRAERFIHQQHLRLMGQRARHRDTLLLPA